MIAQTCIKLFLAGALGGFAGIAQAGNCTVPGTHPTIQAAVDDPGCGIIDLSPQDYFEHLDIDRGLTLAGPSSGGAVIRGQVVVGSAATMVAFNNLRIQSGCVTGTLRVLAGGQMSASGLEVAFTGPDSCLPGLILDDGFE